MKCPKCGYASFAYLDECRRCRADLVGFKARYNMWALRPANVNFLYVEGMKEGLPELGVEVSAEPEFAEEGVPEERVEPGPLETALPDIDLGAELEPAAEEASAVSEEAVPELDVELGELDLGELEPAAGPAEGEEAVHVVEPEEPLDLHEVTQEIDLGEFPADLGEMVIDEDEAAALLEDTGGREVSEEEVLAASSEIDLSDLEEELTLEDVLEEVAALEPEGRETPASELEEPAEDDVLGPTVSLDVGAMEETAEVEERAAATAEPPPGTGMEGEEAEEEPPEGPAILERGLGIDEDLLKEVGEVEAGDAVSAVEGDEAAEIEPFERREGPTVDLSALEDIDVLEVEGVKEEEEPGEEEAPLEMDIGVDAAEFTEERTEEGEAPSAGIEPVPGEIEFEFESDWLEKKEEDEGEDEEKKPYWY